MRFRAKILQAGKTATGIEVPAKVVAALGSSKVPLVRATINGYTYRSSVAVMGGTFMLGISAEVRELITKGASGFAVGFSTDDCQKTYEALRARGVEFTQEPTTRDYGTDVGLRDPFGNHIRIVQRPSA